MTWIRTNYNIVGVHTLCFPLNPIPLDGETLEELETFMYLGITIDEQEVDADVTARVGRAKAIFLRLR